MMGQKAFDDAGGSNGGNKLGYDDEDAAILWSVL